MSDKVDGFGIALVTDSRMDKARCSEYFMVANPQDRPEIPVEARPIEVTLRGISHFIIEIDGVLEHSFNDTIFAKTIVSSPSIQVSIARGAKEFGRQLFPTPD
jgi:hypothetical protein